MPNGQMFNTISIKYGSMDFDFSTKTDFSGHAVPHRYGVFSVCNFDFWHLGRAEANRNVDIGLRYQVGVDEIRLGRIYF
jgi:hypothetical protein